MGKSVRTARYVRFHDLRGQLRRMSMSDAARYCFQCLERDEPDTAAVLEQLLKIEPAHPDLLILFKNACKKAGKSEMALQPFRKALALRPDSSAVYCGFGRALQDCGSHQEAVAAFQLALRLDPANYLASINLGVSLQQLQRDEEAVACFEAALLHQHPPPVLTAICTALAIGLRDLGRSEQALLPIRRTLEFSRGLPAEVGILSDLADALDECGHFEQSLRCHQQAFALAPPTALNRCALGLALLRAGDFPRGFAGYEARLELYAKPEDKSFPQLFPQLRWNGGEVAGKRIVLCYEQGLGDTIQFARYASVLKQRGATVILSVQPPLLPLFAGFSGVDQLITDGAMIQPFDLQCPMMSLPLPCRTTVDTIPGQAPYLHADQERRRVWRGRFANATGLKVGLVWAGNPDNKSDRHRSLSLDLLRPLLDTPDTSFYSLQVGPPSAEIAALGVTDRIQDLSPDFADTAAALMEMDLLIAADTSIAHLAGALGVETWLLLSIAPDWRWMVEREDSPWYPTMRLFRQRKHRDWPEVITRVQAELQRRARKIIQ